MQVPVTATNVAAAASTSSMTLVTNGAAQQQAGDVVHMVATLLDQTSQMVYVLDGVTLTAVGRCSTRHAACHTCATWHPSGWNAWQACHLG
jgi:flavoprotein